MSALSLRTSLPALLALAASLPAQGSTNLTIESHVPFSPCEVGDVWGMGDYMLVARRNAGFSVVDTRNPGNPISVTVTPPGYPVSSSSYGVGDIKADDRYIYVTD